jgi:hypothetical protein
MVEDPYQYHLEVDRRAPARRFLRIFAIFVIVIALIVASINLAAYRYMLSENNQAIVQLLSGWGRIYKPILFDELKPNVAVFGASWARDAFDPIETSDLLGVKVFNHAVSGGTPYETRRFADSSLDNPELKAAVINLDTFYRDELGARFRYGFDESILDLNSEHEPNPFVGLRRAYSLALGGWAVGANIKLISSIIARDRGAARPDYLESYQSANLTKSRYLIPETRQRIFPGFDGAEAVPHQQFPARFLVPEPAELDLLIDGFCANGIDVYAYFTPHHSRKPEECDPQAREELATLKFLRRKQTTCGAKIGYFDFSYPNVVTLEGVLTPVKSSEYYRPDGHPRPSVGLLMAASMFGNEFPPDTPTLLEQDFGVDLLTHPDAEGWLLDRAARCEGDWGDSGYSGYAAALAEQ